MSLKSEEKTFGAGNFKFSGTSLDALEEPFYSLIHATVDTSGSVAPFADLISAMFRRVAERLKLIDTSANLLMRVTTFNSGPATEVHGFRLIDNVDPVADYPVPHCDNMTAAYDATEEALDAIGAYAQELAQKRYKVNGILYVLTDGDDNASQRATTKTIKAKLEALRIGDRHKEVKWLDSLAVILIAVNTQSSDYWKRLETFKNEVGVDKFIKIEDVETSLDELVEYIIRTTETTTMAHGTGKPSEDLEF